MANTSTEPIGWVESRLSMIFSVWLCIMRLSLCLGLIVLVMLGGLSQVAAASAHFVTCDDIARRDKAGQPVDAGQENWSAMAKIICASIEQMRQMSPGDNQPRAEQDAIHRLYLTAVDGEALRIRAVPSCMRQNVGDGDIEQLFIKIVRSFLAQNAGTLRSPNPIQIMTTTRWPEKLEGMVHMGQDDPMPISWLFRCRSDGGCKMFDIQLGSAVSMIELMRRELSNSPRCRR